MIVRSPARVRSARLQTVGTRPQSRKGSQRPKKKAARTLVNWVNGSLIAPPLAQNLTGQVFPHFSHSPQHFLAFSKRKVQRSGEHPCRCGLRSLSRVIPLFSRDSVNSSVGMGFCGFFRPAHPRRCGGHKGNVRLQFCKYIMGLRLHMAHSCSTSKLARVHSPQLDGCLMGQWHRWSLYPPS